MKKELQKTLSDAYDKLPGVLKKLIMSTDLGEKMVGISERNSIRTDQAADLENEIAFVLLGMEKPQDFVDNIHRHLNLPRERAVSIAKDVNDTIFFPVRSALLSLHGPDGKNKSPTIEPKKEDTPTVGKSVERSVVPETKTPKNIMKEKLGGTVHAPEKKETVTKPKNYEVDPYRERIDG